MQQHVSGCHSLASESTGPSAGADAPPAHALRCCQGQRSALRAPRQPERACCAARRWDATECSTTHTWTCRSALTMLIGQAVVDADDDVDGSDHAAAGGAHECDVVGSVQLRHNSRTRGGHRLVYRGPAAAMALRCSLSDGFPVTDERIIRGGPYMHGSYRVPGPKPCMCTPALQCVCQALRS